MCKTIECPDITTPENAMKMQIESYQSIIYNTKFETLIQLQKKEELLKQLRGYLDDYADLIIYSNIRVETNHYVDEDEIWVESKHTLEITITVLTPGLLVKLEEGISDKWECRTDRDGIMYMYFDLSKGNVTYVDE